MGLRRSPDRRLHSYDSLGRNHQTSQVLSDTSYTSSQLYDDWNRLITQQYQRGSDPVKAFDSRYNNLGYLARIERASLVLWQAQVQDAAQRVQLAQYGNGLSQQRSYYRYSGRLEHAEVATAGQINRLQEGYQYDNLGNVALRSQYWDLGGFQERQTCHFTITTHSPAQECFQAGD